ncbi:DUF4905 domain-containing protein [Algivirga pacifica]|uniref:DUF4905 domain-containing protein n=1 Tax=Algivirga pacifica TaxID=1162670 RepID=A0ABP9DDP6_9BACT
MKMEIKEIITHKKEGWQVWRLLYEKDFVIVEWRNEEARKVDFMKIDLKEGKIDWEGISLEEDWWVGASAIADDHLYLYNFDEEEQVPKVRNIIAIDHHNGKVKWIKEGCQYLDAQNDEIQAIHPASGSYLLLAATDGRTLKEAQELPELQSTTTNVEENIHRYTETNPHFDTFKRFLSKSLHIHPHKQILYLEHKEGFTLSFYMEEDSSAKIYSHWLCTFSKGGDLLQKICLQAQTEEVSLDAFWSQENYLFYLVEKDTLVVNRI